MGEIGGEHAKEESLDRFFYGRSFCDPREKRGDK